MSTIAENIRTIRETMAEAARQAGRDPSEIRLCAATKMNDAAAVRAAIEAGVDCCGENRVQEIQEKRPQGAYEGKPLHFIGHLQTNKVKYIVGVVDLIHGFINTVNAATDVERDWQSYVQQQKQQELEQIIAEEKLKPAEAQRFVANAFRDGALKTTGTDIDQILPPVSRFGGGNRTEKKKTIIQRLAQFFEKYFGI